MFIDGFMVVVYLIAVLLTNILASKRKIKNVRKFSLSGKKYGIFVLVATLSAAFLGGDFSIGNDTKVVQVGIGNIFALHGFSLAIMLSGKHVVPNIKNLKIYLLPEKL